MRTSPHGAPLLVVRGGTGIDARVLRRSLVFANGRALTQDPAFAIRCIVDVTVRALSAAVNDPTSAVEGFDALDAVLRRLAGRDLGASAIVAPGGAVRLVLPTPGWEELIDLALTEPRRHGADAPQVTRRLMALLQELEDVLPAERRMAVCRHRELLQADLERLYPNPDERAFAATPDRLGIGGSVLRRAADALAHY